jgi:hypothetical protein
MPLAECLQPETQAGFRKHRSTRDNIFLLSELMDEVIRTGNGCVFAFIDFVSAFDTVSHHFLDESMGEIEAELIEQNRLQEVLQLRKCRAMFRAIYAKASACVRVTDSAGQRMCSDLFPVDRGVVQGDIFSPVAFILALAVVMMRHGKRRGVQNTISSSASNEGGGNTDEDGDSMPELHSDSGDEGSSDRESNRPERTLFQLIEELEYADDAALADKTAREASERVSRLAAGALKDADMEISVPKTEAMHVRDQPAVSPVRRADYTDKELAKLLKHKCEYCGDGFDTKQGRNQHVTSCGLASRAVHEQDFEVEAVLDARAPPEHRFYKVLWKGWAESDDYWEPWRHLLNSADATDKFWANSGLDKESCIEAAGESRCKWCCKLYTGGYADRSLKSHHTKGCDHEPKSRVGTRAEKAAVRQKRKRAQDTLEKVVLQGKELQNVYEFKYLGHWFTADAGRRHAVNIRMAKAKARFGQLWQIWSSTAFPTTAKIRLFGAAVVSVLVYGSEAWLLDSALEASLRGWCAKCMVHITGRGVRDECVSPSYPLVNQVRQKRLKWLGHVLRAGEENLVRAAVVKMCKGCIKGGRTAGGTVLMDAPEFKTVEGLMAAAEDKLEWNSLTNSLCPKVRKERKNKTGIDVFV